MEVYYCKLLKPYEVLYPLKVDRDNLKIYALSSIQPLK